MHSMAMAAERSSSRQPGELSATRVVDGPGQPATHSHASPGGVQMKMLDSGPTKGKEYPEEVLRAAGPFLTGDATADEDILGFYLVRHNMLHGGS